MFDACCASCTFLHQVKGHLGLSDKVVSAVSQVAGRQHNAPNTQAAGVKRGRFDVVPQAAAPNAGAQVRAGLDDVIGL